MYTELFRRHRRNDKFFGQIEVDIIQRGIIFYRII